MMESTLNDPQRRVTLGMLVGAWLIMVAPVAAAQEVDSRWAPWLGCWRAVDETATAPVLCVVPLAGEAAIEMLTTVDGRVVSRESIFADGQEHAVSRDECEGWERAEFSGDSHRIYIGSELTCGASAHRISTGVMSMVSPFEWLDVRTIDVDGQSVPWALRYRLASEADFQAAGQGDLFSAQGSEARMARMVASVPIAINDVIEANGKVSAETLQLWVVERGEPFALDANRLIEMADAGVPPSVIDVVVAVSYPESSWSTRDVLRGAARRTPHEDAQATATVGVSTRLETRFTIRIHAMAIILATDMAPGTALATTAGIDTATAGTASEGTTTDSADTALRSLSSDDAAVQPTPVPRRVGW